MKLTRKLLPLFALVVLVLAGTACKSKGPYVPKADADAHELSTEPINFLHPKLKGYLGSDKAIVEQTDDGRMKVALTLRSKRSEKQLHVQVRCLFKDDQGMSTGDETDWVSMFFDPGQTQTYRAESLTRSVHSYTVEVRLPKQPKR